MKRTLLLCSFSAVLGAVVSLVLSGPPDRGEGSDRAGAALANGTAVMGAPADPQADREPGPPAGFDDVGRPRNPPAPDLDELTPEERVNIAVYAKANRSVVNITTEGYRGDRFLLLDLPSKGEGSGAVIDRQGHIVTNWHVVEGAREIQVTLFNGKSYDARLVGRDLTNDVAVISIQAPSEEFFPVVFGDSGRLLVGQRVYALGNPFGLERTLSTGIISSLDRFVRSRASDRKVKQIIQIDAAINPGSSGGPLLDTRARMVGMNFAIATKTGESAGVGFAIPINTIARVVPQLIRHGKVIRPEIGIARVFETEKGLLIATLVPGGAAEKAGLHGPRRVRQQRRQGPFLYTYETMDRTAADLIVGLDGQPVKTADGFLTMLDSKQPGDQVVVRIVRGGREMNVTVRLEAGEG
jgi:S1-C subfamily serine protease